MKKQRREATLDRRTFLSTTGGGLLAAAVPGGGGLAKIAEPREAQPSRNPEGESGPKRKIPIGVFDPVYENLSLDEMLDKVSALGLEAMEIGTGGYPGSAHCPVDDLLQDPAKAKAWMRKFEDRGIRVATLSCHGNPIHPDPKHAKRDEETFNARRNSVIKSSAVGKTLNSAGFVMYIATSRTITDMVMLTLIRMSRKNVGSGVIIANTMPKTEMGITSSGPAAL